MSPVDSPATMTAATYTRFGLPDVVSLEQVPIRAPKPNEVRIRTHASTVSIADRGHFHIVIDSTYHLAEVVEAHRRVDTGRNA